MILVSKESMEENNFNFNKAVFPGIQGGPLMHVIAAKAVCFKEALQDSFKTYQQGIVDNAQALCNGLKNRGIKIVSDGTDNHLMLVDLTPFDLTGKAIEKLLDEAHITANQKYDSERSEISVCHKRYPSRNTICYIQRHEYRGYGQDRRSNFHRHQRRR